MIKLYKVNTPTTLQIEAVECGAASLSMILGYYGKYVPLETLRIECGVSRDGSKASNILKAARNFGLEAKGYKKEPEELKKMILPIIVFWNFNHFLVVEGFNKKGEVFLNDPASGKKKVSWDEFDKAFTGVVLTFTPTKFFKADSKKPSIFPGLFRRLKPSFSQLLIVFIAGILMSIPGLLIPIFSKIFIDNYLIQGMENWVLPLIYIMIATAAINIGLNFLQQHYLLKIENAIAISESSKLFWHIVRLPMDFFNQRMSGEIGNRISLNDNVASVISGQLATNMIGLVTIIMYAALMFYYDVTLTLIGIAFVVLNIFIFQLIIKHIADKSKKLSIAQGKLLGVAMSGLQSIETLKASANENDFFIKWSGNQAKMQNATNEMVFINQIAMVLPVLFAAINIAIILIVGSFRVMDGYMTIGMLVAFQSLMYSFTEPVVSLMSLGATIKDLEGDMNYLDDVLKYPVEEKLNINTNTNKKYSSAKLDGKIELKNITFGYSKLANPLVKDFNITIAAGKRVAIIGSSGSGKSTLAKMVTGLYKPWSGDILIDEQNIKEIDNNIITNSIAIVNQEIFLFKGTIKENITLWDTSLSDEEIITAAKDACIHDHIASLPNAYNTLVEEYGSNFSGGQRQRIELARAFVNNPTIIVLDEATSALDPITEMKIDENIRRRGATCIIIAHRLSTIRDADSIIVLDKGTIIQEGTHNYLKSIDGLYAELINNE
ncbi:MAG: NHLP family bacteriocin export ABC transporter peptidase/permease/ATPase subunit [Arcobacteraceae bacterium]